MKDWIIIGQPSVFPLWLRTSAQCGPSIRHPIVGNHADKTAPTSSQFYAESVDSLGYTLGSSIRSATLIPAPCSSRRADTAHGLNQCFPFWNLTPEESDRSTSLLCFNGVLHFGWSSLSALFSLSGTYEC